MRMKRLSLLALVALGLAPGTFVRSEISPKDYSSPVEIAALRVGKLSAGPLTLEGAWLMESENDHFGGFSSLVATREGEFFSASDSGRMMRFPRPDRGQGEISIAPFLASRELDKMAVDVESLAIDPETGALWAGLEWAQEIIALGTKLDRRKSVRPLEMADWGGNSGPESMVRLGDGRFIVIEERTSPGSRHRALLFAQDPVLAETPLSFFLQGREGYRPSDAALLPDGRIAVLLRSMAWSLPLRFPTLIVIADPESIEEGEVLPTQVLARIDEPLPSDNWEGLTVIEDSPGQWDFWLISDDNFATYMRTTVIKLRWDRRAHQARQKARR